MRAEHGWVSLHHGDVWDSSSDVAFVLDQAIDPDVPPGAQSSSEWLAARVAENVLSSVQDGVSETTTEPWPALPRGGMALPGTRTDGVWMYLWYGPDADREAGAVVSFPPIPVDSG